MQTNTQQVAKTKHKNICETYRPEPENRAGPWWSINLIEWKQSRFFIIFRKLRIHQNVYLHYHYRETFFFSTFFLLLLLVPAGTYIYLKYITSLKTVSDFTVCTAPAALSV